MLVVGPSSVGKSEYISSLIDSGCADRASVRFAYEYRGDNIPDAGDDVVVHYNMLDPFGNDADLVDKDIELDSTLQTLLSATEARHATILVAPKKVITKRTLMRPYLEEKLSAAQVRYPKKSIFEFYSRIDIENIYEKWHEFLLRNNFEIIYISTENREYRALSGFEECLSVLKRDHPVPYTSEEVSTALEGFDFPYHSVPGFEHITGINQDRGGTLSAIRSHLRGESILDIGCGIGAFCFSAEQLGYRSVVGTELKKERFLAACALAAVSNSRCEFRFVDVLKEDYVHVPADTVLLLNVIHHLSNPIAGLRKAANLANEVLILEYPTLDDPKFLSSLESTSFDRSLPLIGVSRFVDLDQTFVFSDAALWRILVENEKAFVEIDFIQSPMDRSRRIAVCKK